VLATALACAIIQPRTCCSALVEREIGPSQMARAMLVVWARTGQNDKFTTTCVCSLQGFLNDRAMY
jgi:hypothetical protein